MLIIPKQLIHMLSYMNFKKFIIISSTLLLTSCSNSQSWFGEDKKLELSGERISILNTTNDLQVSSDAKKTQVTLAATNKNDSWNTLDLENGKNFFLKDNLESKYSLNLTSSRDFQLVSQPIAFKNTMIAMDAQGKIIAYDLMDGKMLWENDYFYNLEGSTFLSSNYLNGGLFYQDGKIYATAGVNIVLCLNEDNGEVIWQTNLSSPTRSIPLFADNMLFLKSIDNKIFALDSKTGKVEWSYLSISEDVNILNSIATQHKNNLLVTYNDSGEVIALKNRDGAEEWVSFMPSQMGSVSTNKTFFNTQPSVTIDDDIVFVADKEGSLMALNIHSGENIWKKNLKLSKRFWICGNTIFAIADNNKLVAIDKKTANILWISELVSLEEGDKKPTWSSPIVANSKVVTVSDNGWALFFDSTSGSLSHKMEVAKYVAFPPMIIDGNMLILSDNGSISFYGN